MLANGRERDSHVLRLTDSITQLSWNLEKDIDQWLVVFPKLIGRMKKS